MYKLTSTRVRRAYYGGKNIDTLTGIEAPSVSRYPEDWLCSVTEAFNPDMVVKGEGLSRTEDGRYLKDIIEANKEDMIGKETEMRLLFKLLDSAERLAIQGHPTVSFAKEHFNSNYGKTECWYILRDGGCVYLGFKKGITKEYWKQLFEEQNVEAMLECLHRFEVSRGDMIFVAGGVPHAIGEDCFMAELQEPTDLMVITERVTPSGIQLAESKLHCGLGFERMFDCFQYEGMEREEVKERFFLRPKQIGKDRTLLVGNETTDIFRLEELSVEDAQGFAVDNYGIVLVTEGKGSINGHMVQSGSRFFIPFSEKELICEGKMKFLFCSAAEQ